MLYRYARPARLRCSPAIRSRQGSILNTLAVGIAETADSVVSVLKGWPDYRQG